MKIYAFETKNGNRFDVKACSAYAAANKIKAIPHLERIVTGYYYVYDKDGFHCNNSGFDGRIYFNN